VSGSGCQVLRIRGLVLGARGWGKEGASPRAVGVSPRVAFLKSLALTRLGSGVLERIVDLTGLEHLMQEQDSPWGRVAPDSGDSVLCGKPLGSYVTWADGPLSLVPGTSRAITLEITYKKTIRNTPKSQIATAHGKGTPR
jgi:hypothetical protein